MKRKTTQQSLLTAILLSCAIPSFAIYKCESGGKIVYSDTACNGGTEMHINTTPSPDAEAALRRAAQEKRQAERLESARLKREASEAKEQKRVAREEATKRKRCDTLARRQKWAEEDAASVAGTKVEAARRKARRAAEEYQAECRGQDKLSLAH
ncbi:MAG TPA: DUF4124 domain-containing protein [Noviherbaspirillum sp.]|nr:DUF4124 domain-containing protein [Noviherbaspirillum sp.]